MNDFMREHLMTILMVNVIRNLLLIHLNIHLFDLMFLFFFIHQPFSFI